jgi:hypothetical protein
MAGIAAQQIADREDGFFWHTRFELDNNSPAFHFHLHTPLHGLDRPIILDYDADPEETVLTKYDFGGEQKPANSVIVVGEGEGAAALVARRDSTAHPLGAFTAGRPRYVEVISQTDIKNITPLSVHAIKRWTRHKVPFKTAHVTMHDPDTEYVAFDIGDTLNLRINDHAVQVFDRYRVVVKQTAFTKEGDKIIDLDLEEPFVVFEGE